MKLADLKTPFLSERVSWRVGSTSADKRRGMALAYIDSRDVQDRLDQVCAPENWQCRYAELGQKTICEIGIKIGPEWVWKADGAGDTDFEAEKGALSDAFKRAAVKWGVGRYLYDLPAEWVDIETMGKGFKIKDSEMVRLMAVLEGKSAGQGRPVVTENKTALKSIAREMSRMIHGFADVGEMEEWWSSKESQANIAKISAEYPSWVEHTPDGDSDHLGLKQQFMKRRDELGGVK